MASYVAKCFEWNVKSCMFLPSISIKQHRGSGPIDSSTDYYIDWSYLLTDYEVYRSYSTDLKFSPLHQHSIVLFTTTELRMVRALEWDIYEWELHFITLIIEICFSDPQFHSLKPELFYFVCKAITLTVSQDIQEMMIYLYMPTLQTALMDTFLYTILPVMFC